MIGQTKIISKINNLTLDNLSHTILLEGLKGSGRHSIVKLLSEKFNIEIVDLSDLKINDELINELSIISIPKIYLIDIQQLTIKDQNVLLKFLEEPNSYCYNILLCENSSQLLPTILNRCQLYKLEPYTKEELKLFYDEYTQFQEFKYENDKIFDIAATPGDLVELILNTDLEKTLSLIDNILSNIANANFANVLVLVDKIREFNPDKGLTNFEMFLKIFMFCIHKYIIENNLFDCIKLYDAYNLVRELYQDYKKSSLHLNNKYLYEHFLLNFKLLMK